MEVEKKAENMKGKNLLLTDLLIGHRAACDWPCCMSFVGKVGGSSVGRAVCHTREGKELAGLRMNRSEILKQGADSGSWAPSATMVYL